MWGERVSLVGPLSSRHRSTHNNGKMSSSGRKPAPQAPTEAAMRSLHGPTREEQEEALLEKMQTLSSLLNKVNAAIDDCPSTAASSRPPTGLASLQQHPASRGGISTAGSKPLTGRSRGGTAIPGTGASSSSLQHAAGKVASGDEPQVLRLGDEPPPEPPKKPDIELVQYTGSQHALGGICSRRKVDARASRSQMGSVLFGEDPSS